MDGSKPSFLNPGSFKKSMQKHAMLDSAIKCAIEMQNEHSLESIVVPESISGSMEARICTICNWENMFEGDFGPGLGPGPGQLL